MDGGVRFSTRSPQVLQRFGILDGEQAGSEVEPGHRSVWPAVTGGLFESAYPTRCCRCGPRSWPSARVCWGTGSARRPARGSRCAPLFAAALRSHETGRSERITG